jgi:hypothetical protein
MQEEIVSKIRKLQALADRAGSEHEAALAAEMVATLLRKHNLDIGVIQLEREETEASEGSHEHDSSRWEAHWTAVGAAVCSILDVANYRRTRNEPLKDIFGRVKGVHQVQQMVFYGLKANVQAAQVTYQYLLASVEAVLESDIRGGHLFGMSDRRSFRIGCAMRIKEEAAKVRQAKQLHHAPTSEETALVRLEGRLIARHTAKLHLSKGRNSSGASNPEAYARGYNAGSRVDVHGARSSRMLR